MVGTLDLITNNMIRYNLSMAEHYIYIYNIPILSAPSCMTMAMS